MRAFALIFFAVGASDAWALLDARRVRRSNRLLSTANFGQLKVTASDAANSDNFGGSVAIDGDTVVIGASGTGTGGAVYVLRTSDGGATYAQVAKLMATDGAASDSFGVSVAIDGGTIVVGASGDDDASSCTDDACNSGSVYVFRTIDDWATHTEIKLTATDAAVRDIFGISVAIDGGTIVVGAYGDDVDGSYSGAVYVFRTSDGGATYIEAAKLTVSDAGASDYFGISVAIDGSTIVVGAEGDDDSGSAYVFHTSDGGATYGQVVKLTAADAASNDYFGRSVAIDGGTIVVGAYGDDPGGSVYVFRTTDGGATYGQVAKLTAADAAAYDYFGGSVAIDGDTIVVGAHWDDDAGDDSGSAYVFRTTDGGATYVQVAKLTASDAAASDWFGISVAIAGDTVVVGASGDVVGAEGDDDSGSAYVFSTTAALGSDSATRAGGTLATALLAFAATALAL